MVSSAIRNLFALASFQKAEIARAALASAISAF